MWHTKQKIWHKIKFHAIFLTPSNMSSCSTKPYKIDHGLSMANAEYLIVHWNSYKYFPFGIVHNSMLQTNTLSSRKTEHNTQTSWQNNKTHVTAQSNQEMEKILKNTV